MREILFESRNFTVVRDELVSASTGALGPVEFIEQPPVVIAVAVMDDGRVVLVSHSRPILGVTLLECPGGKMDPGEEPSVAVQRELEEEAGYSAGRLAYLTQFFTSVGTSTEEVHVFVASDLKPHPRREEDVRRMGVVTLHMSEIASRLEANEIRDGKTLAALSRYAISEGLLSWRSE